MSRHAAAPRSRRGLVVIILLATITIGGAAVAQVWTHFKAIEYGYKIAQARRERAKLVERNRRLRIELAWLKSPERVARIARNELGLREPEPEQIHRLRRSARIPPPPRPSAPVATLQSPVPSGAKP